MTDLFTPSVDGPVPLADPSPAVALLPAAAAPSPFELGEVLAEIDTEIGWRHGVYARRVAEKRMSQDAANRKIQLMMHIRRVVQSLESNAEYFRACLKHRKDLVECINVLEGKGT